MEIGGEGEREVRSRAGGSGCDARNEGLVEYGGGHLRRHNLPVLIDVQGVILKLD